jgi:hypothetical protein
MSQSIVEQQQRQIESLTAEVAQLKALARVPQRTDGDSIRLSRESSSGSPWSHSSPATGSAKGCDEKDDVMAGRQITKEMAIKIVKKLEAAKRAGPNLAHDLYDVYHNDILIASFGVRRSSDRDIGHDHIPHAIGVGTGFAKGLAQCPNSRDDYLRKVGALAPDPDAGE